MFLNGIKNAAAKRKISQLVSERSGTEFSEKIKKIGIVIDARNIPALEQLTKIPSIFKLEGATIQIMLFSGASRQFLNTDYTIVNWKNISLKGEVAGDKILAFTREKFDLLITFAEETNTAVHLLTAMCESKLKVGRYPRNIDLYDWVIQADNDVETFVEELGKYIKNLKNT